MLDTILKLKNSLGTLDPNRESDEWDELATLMDGLYTGCYNCVLDNGDGTILRWPKLKTSLDDWERGMKVHKELSDLGLPFVPKLLLLVEGDQPYAVVEKVNGTTLDECDKFSADDIRDTVRALHGYGWLHNDLHEHNILVDQTNGGIWLIDFDSARKPIDDAQRLFDLELEMLDWMFDDLG